jgi:hypothetical protein
VICDILPPQPMRVFLHLNNSSGNKWFNLKIPCWSVYTIIPFLARFSIWHLKPMVLEFIMFLLKDRHLVYKVFPTFRLLFLIFCIALHMQLGLPHPLIVGIPRCVCTQPIGPMGIHFLCCAQGNECIGTHDAICDTFSIIVWDACFHVGQEQLHVFPSTTFNSSCWWVDIVLTKDDIRTLVDIVIINPKWVDHFSTLVIFLRQKISITL